MNGLELMGFIKERQATQIRGLRQAHNIFPKLVIVRTGSDKTTDLYLKLKQEYGSDILVDVEVINATDEEIIGIIEKLNHDKTVHGIVVQLPLADKSKTEKVVNTIDPTKDIDGLGDKSIYTPATPMAIDWLLVGYNIDLNNKKIAIVGNGRLVGAPLYKLWKNNGLNVEVYNSKTENIGEKLVEADVIVSATGVPRIIQDSMVKYGAVIVDAGMANDSGGIVGDVSEAVRYRPDVIITPEKGGVGPLTIAAFFDNLIQSARTNIKK